MLKRIKFAYGLSRGGRHTWLFSYGRVYEVHWDQIGSNLYDSSPFESFEWLSSLIVIPPDAVSERLQDLFDHLTDHEAAWDVTLPQVIGPGRVTL